MLSIRGASAKLLACSNITSSSIPTVQGRHVSGDGQRPQAGAGAYLERAHGSGRAPRRLCTPPRQLLSLSLLAGRHQMSEEGELSRVVNERLGVPLNAQQQRLPRPSMPSMTPSSAHATACRPPPSRSIAW